MKWRNIRFGLDLFLIICVIIFSIGLKSTTQAISDVKCDEPIYQVDTAEKLVSITFDINWAEKDNLESILDILKKYNIKGTFFIMGGWVNYSEDNVNKLIAINEGGNEIGNHSYIHPSFSKIGKDRMKEELQKTDAIIEKYINKKPVLFRFPSGDYNKESFNYVKSLGYVPIQWNIDSVDWKQLGAQIEYDRVMKNVKPGSILLFHNNAKYTPENLEKIINELKSQGYTFKSVGEMIYSENYYVDDKGIQHKNNNIY